MRPAHTDERRVDSDNLDPALLVRRGKRAHDPDDRVLGPAVVRLAVEGVEASH
jgi:hypothetical protein